MSILKKRVVYITGILILLNLALSYWLYLDMTQKRILDTSNLIEIAKLNFKHQEVKRKLSTSIVWDDVEVNESLFLQDSVLTLDNSEAVIKLHSGAEIELNANSLVVLEKIEDKFALNFIRGNIFTRSEGADLKIKMKNKRLDLSKANASISTEDISVISGVVKVDNQKIQKGEKGKIIKGKLESIEKDVFSIIKPKYNQRLFMTKAKEKVDLLWEKSQDLGWVNVDIARDFKFKDLILTRKKVLENKLALLLGPGIYYFRLSGILNNTVKNSIPVKFSLTHEFSPIAIAPVDKALEKFKGDKAKLLFKWKPDKIQKNFLMEISSDKNFKNIIYTKRTQLTQTIANIEAGDYYWRVKAFHEYRKEPLLSKAYFFQVQKMERLPPPKIIFPENKEIYFKRLMSDNKINFSWESVEGASRYQLLVAKDNNLKKILFKKHLFSTAYSYSLPKEGKYFWTVRAIDMLKELSDMKYKYRFNVIDKPLISLKFPINKFKVVMKNKDEKIKFEWDAKKDFGKYKLLIAKDSLFEEIIKTYKSTTTELLIAGFPKGSYFWKVEQYSKGEKVNVSPKNSFIVEKYKWLTAPELKLPKADQAIEFFDDKEIQFKWQKIEGALGYKFILRNKKSTAGKEIETKISKENYVLVDIPEFGEYEWTVRAIDKNELLGRTSKRFFTVIPEKRLKVPKGHTIKIE